MAKIKAGRALIVVKDNANLNDFSDFIKELHIVKPIKKLWMNKITLIIIPW